MKINKIKKAKYNPRKMNKDARDALSKSIEEYQDISGIVINNKTGNILAGNHRFDDICSKYGKKTISLDNVIGEFYAINSKDNFTGFLARVVEWPESKEKAANITANNDLISGEFTSDLQDILQELDDELGEDTMIDLRLDELMVDLDNDLDLTLDDDDDFVDHVQQNSNKEFEKEDTKKVEEEKFDDEEEGQKYHVLKVTVPVELKDDVKDDLLEFLSTKDYYKDIVIV